MPANPYAAVLDVPNERWFRPPSSAVGGPGPRAFHCAVAMGSQLYVLCGRTGRQQHGDAWVGLALFTTLFCKSKHGSLHDSQYSPRNQADTRE